MQGLIYSWGTHRNSTNHRDCASPDKTGTCPGKRA